MKKDKDFETKGCPKCGIGLLTQKLGKYGWFVSCNRCPFCSYTANKKLVIEKRRPLFEIHQGHIIENT